MIPSFHEDLDILEVKERPCSHFPPHLHKSMEFIYVTEGTLEVGTGTDLFHMERGDLALIFPNLIHHFQVFDKGSRCISMLAAPSYFGSYKDVLGKQRPESPVVKASDLHQDVLYVLSALEHSKNSEGNYPTQHQDALSHAWIQVILSRCLPLMNLQPREDFRNQDLVSKIITFIATHFRESLTLPQVAEAVGVNQFSLSRVFSKTFHQNFNHYINSVRLEHASALLADSKASITEILQDCGFQSQTTFNRTFQNFYHMTPRQYRQSRQ
ncbi:MAG: AraC family transcriptional regulator [Lachnospiraceae bacterium]|nr:AraC family transcriptional regulator [Lachnospiraceae bacterium]